MAKRVADTTTLAPGVSTSCSASPATAACNALFLSSSGSVLASVATARDRVRQLQADFLDWLNVAIEVMLDVRPGVVERFPDHIGGIGAIDRATDACLSLDLLSPTTAHWIRANLQTCGRAVDAGDGGTSGIPALLHGAAQASWASQRL
jgi:hypothetical protein